MWMAGSILPVSPSPRATNTPSVLDTLSLYTRCTSTLLQSRYCTQALKISTRCGYVGIQLLSLHNTSAGSNSRGASGAANTPLSWVALCCGSEPCGLVNCLARGLGTCGVDGTEHLSLAEVFPSERGSCARGAAAAAGQRRGGCCGSHVRQLHGVKLPGCCKGHPSKQEGQRAYHKLFQKEVSVSGVCTVLRCRLIPGIRRPLLRPPLVCLALVGNEL